MRAIGKLLSVLFVLILLLSAYSGAAQPAATTAPAAKARPAGVPTEGKSARIDAILKRGTLRVGVLGEMPWLMENTTGAAGDMWYGSSWTLAKEYATRLGVKLEAIPVSHETKIPVLASNQVDITIAPLAATDDRKKVVDFVIYSKSSICYVGSKTNPKVAALKSVEDLNNENLTLAFFQGQPFENYIPTRFPKLKLRGVQGSGAVAPIEEILSNRADLTGLDAVKVPELLKQYPQFVSFPPGDDCLRSSEMATPIGQAIDKNQPDFLNFLTGVEKQIESKLQDEEVKTMKRGS